MLSRAPSQAEVGSLEELKSHFSNDYSEAQWLIIERAYNMAAKAHEGQFRRSGKPYITHPVGVAFILCSLSMDLSTIVTALLHDTVEDTDLTLEDVGREFDDSIRLLVDGVTKISKIKFKNAHEKQRENISKVIISMGKDVRVILVKLADRLHNMRDLSYLPVYKQRRIAQETLDIYLPLASRLGIQSLKVELEDLCFKYLYPQQYNNLSKKVQRSEEERKNFLENSIARLEEELKKSKISSFSVDGRYKNLFSMYQKMQRKNLSFEQIYDHLALRVCVENSPDTYKVLGLVHALWKPIPGRFKDFIAIPKVNGYQSLHTSVIGFKAERLEVQIRTHEMHRISEYGIASHWIYKENKNFEKDYLDNILWLKELVGYHKNNSSSSDEFLEGVQVDLLEGENYAFTPKGDVKEFPEGATIIDFAYSIHTSLGNHLDCAIIDGRSVPHTYKIRNGDIIHIKTSERQTPSKVWLDHCVTSRAKSAVRHFIRSQERYEYKELGRILISQYFSKNNLDFKKYIASSKSLKSLLNRYSVKSDFDFYVAIGCGKVDKEDVFYFLNPQLLKTEAPSEKEATSKVVGKTSLPKPGQKSPPVLQKEASSIEGEKASEAGEDIILVTGDPRSLTKLGICCTPVPGDPITGFIDADAKGVHRTVDIHHSKCQKVFSYLPERRVHVEWSSEISASQSFEVKISVVCEDASGRLKHLSEALSESLVNIVNLSIDYLIDHKVRCIFTIKVNHLEKVSDAMTNLQALDGVITVQRLGL